MNVLIINTTRFGDLLQTQATINDLTSKGHVVGLLCLENFVAATTMLTGLSYVYPFPGARLLVYLSEEDIFMDSDGEFKLKDPSTPGWVSSLSLLETFRKKILDTFDFDFCINLTASISARILTLFLSESKPIEGFCLDSNGFGVNTSSWATFLQAAGVSRGVSPFNVTDLFRNVALPDDKKLQGNGSLVLPDAKIVSQIQTELSEGSPDSCKGYVAFQLGASDENRRWPSEYFAEIGQRLWENFSLCPVLLGTSKELVYLDEYVVNCNHPFISLVGKTNLSQLAAALRFCLFLLTNDTGTMHLAAGQNIPIVGIFLVNAQPWDTGPYLENCCLLEPNIACHPCPYGSDCLHDFACRTVIQPDEVWKLVQFFLTEGNWSNSDTIQTETMRVWISQFDSHGEMSLKALSQHGSEDRTLWLIALRFFLRQFLTRDREQSFYANFEECQVRLSSEGRLSLEKDLITCSNLLELLEQQLRLLMIKPNPLLSEKFMITWDKICKELIGSRWLSSLSLLWKEDSQVDNNGLQYELVVINQYVSLLRGLHHFVKHE